MKNTAPVIKLLLVLLPWLTGGCASDRPPSGGVADKTPLKVLSCSPGDSSVHVSLNSIRLTFNSFIPVKQLLDGLVFTPSVGKYDIVVDGRTAEIRLCEPLKKNQSYTLRLDKNIKDGKNRTFSTPFAISFFTGATIDNGTIKGHVFNRDNSPATNAIVLAFADRPESASSETLLTRKPDYLIQADDTGSFSFRNIATGSYHVFAADDLNRNMQYNYMFEDLALCSAESVSTGTSALMLRFGGAHSDTGGIVSCKPLDQELLDIKLAYPVNIASFNAEKLVIRHAISHTPVSVIAWYSKNRSMYEIEFTIVTSRMKAAQPYLISFMSDKKGGQTREIEFYASSRSTEKQPPRITILPENNRNPAFMEMTWPSLGEVAIIAFSSPVEKAAVNRATTFAEKGDQTRKNLDFSLITIDARTFALKPTDGFKPEHSYLISVNPGIFSAIKAKPIVSQFTVSTKEDCGAISGKCIADGEWVVVEAKKEGSTSPFSTIVKRDQKGTFKYTFTELPPGNYSISAFIPSGKNKPAQDRHWNPGSIDTGQPAEPFGSLPERVMVRAQWTTNIADIYIMTSR